MDDDYYYDEDDEMTFDHPTLDSDYFDNHSDYDIIDQQSSLIDELYVQNLQEVEKILERDRNWVPEDIKLTTQDNEPPIIFINSTKEKPKIYPIKLATITLNAELPINFNLRVIALYLPLDEKIIGVKCEQVCHRGWFKPKTRKNKNKKKKKGRKDRADFYNQCTINIKPYGDESDELINMKFFPNGKISLTGVKRVEDAEVGLKYILQQINKLEGYISYYIENIEYGNSKNFRKKIKSRKSLLNYLSDLSGLTFDWTKFIDEIQTKGKNPYPNGIKLPFQVAHTLALYNVISTYYNFNFYDERGMTYEKSQELFENILMDPNFEKLCLRVCESYNGDEHNNLEYQIVNGYLFADRRRNLTINETIDETLENLEQEKISFDQFKIIINYYYENDVHVNQYGLLEILRKSDKLNQNQIIEVENFLRHPIRLSTDDKIIFQHFYQLKIINANENIIYNHDFKARFHLNLPGWSTHQAQIKLGSIMDYYSHDYIFISNINTTFNTNFILNREKLHNILVNKYQESNCSFEPNYGGIKLTYLSTIDCQKHADPHDPNILPEEDGCHCKGVSVLIFPNITLITGGRSFRQILQAYEFIKSVMIREFERILKVDKKRPDPLDKYPNVISSNKHIYMKKKFILDNPKNTFILKAIGLLDHFDN